MGRYLISSFIFLISLKVFAQSNEQKLFFGDLSARVIGPGIMSGRVSDLDVVNKNPQTFYVASAGGGVWKTVNGGDTFRPVFNDHTQSIGKVTIDQKNPETVWVGTGEPWVRNSVSVGTGIYKTTNGGNSWSFMGLPNSERISDIIIDPNNSDIVYVAVLGGLWSANDERGLYKTTDGGTSWTKVLYVDENTGATDITLDPEDSNIMYASMWDHRRSPDFFRSGGPGSGIFKSYDAGETWQKLTRDLPDGILGRMAIEVAPGNREKVYLTVEAENSEDNGLYVSENAGENWSKINDDFNITIRPFYYARLKVAPSNENVIYKAGVSLVVSEDGGKSFRPMDGTVHSDVHAIWIDQKDANIAIIGTDGGVYKTVNGAKTFSFFENIPISQFYHAAFDNEQPFNVYGGMQDNGIWVGPSTNRGGVKNSDWEFLSGGDGFHAFPHPEDNNLVYFSVQGGQLFKVNLKDGMPKQIRPYQSNGGPELRFNWNTPVVQSTYNPDRLYIGAQFLYRSNDGGDSWEQISADLTTNNPERQKQKLSGGLSIDNSSAENNTTIYTISESPKNSEVLWVGTDDGKIHVTSDGGESWEDLTENIPAHIPDHSWVSQISASTTNPKEVFVTIDNHREGDMSAYVLTSKDLGKTWQSLSTENLGGYALSIKQDWVNPNLLFLGTEFGLYISIDRGEHWHPFENNLPKVGIRDMAIHPEQNALVLATHGRGIAIIDDLRPLRQLTSQTLAATLTVFDSGTQPIHYTPNGPAIWYGGADTYLAAAENNNPKLAYYMSKRHTFGKMYVEIYNDKGELIRQQPAGKSAGINLVDLQMTHPKPKSAPTGNRVSLFGNIFGPALPEGDYQVKITKGKAEFNAEISLVKKENSIYSNEERQVQYETVMGLYDMIENVGYIYYASQGLIDQAQKIETDGKLAQSMGEYTNSLENLLGDLVYLGGDFYANEGANLSEEISQLYFQIQQYPGRPSKSQLAKMKSLKSRLAEVNRAFEKLVGTDLDAINKKINRRGLTQMSLMVFKEYKSSETGQK